MGDDQDEVHLFFEFNRAIDTLTKRYGVINVADQCRGYANFIERLRAGIEVRHHECSHPHQGALGALGAPWQCLDCGLVIDEKVAPFDPECIGTDECWDGDHGNGCPMTPNAT